MKTFAITTREWERIGEDYKLDDGLCKKILILTARGTCLVPVRLDDENGLEYGPYRFQEGCLNYTVYAYSMADALRVIRNSGHHSMRAVTGLERKEPYRQREQAEVVDGRIVYIFGDSYEISDEYGQEMVIFGECKPDATPAEVYAMHLRNHPAKSDGMVAALCGGAAV